MSENIFTVPKTEPCAILLVDASYSVKTLSNYPSKIPTTIFDEMQKICQTLPHEKFRVLFWNSDNRDNNFGMRVNGVGGIRGVEKVQKEVTKETLSQLFKATAMKITPNCVTAPNLGFENIDDWLAAGLSQTIYFFTDGFIGWNQIQPYELALLKKQLADSIQHIVDKYEKKVEINIIAVEAKPMDLSVEQSKMVGNDVFKALNTNVLSKYVSYAPNKTDGYIHINRGGKTIPGFVPFGSRSFSILHTNQFMQYLSDFIETNKNDEDVLLRTIQDLTVTLNVLTKDRPAKMRAQTFNLFMQMFQGTVIDSSMVEYLLSQGLAAEACGSAQLYADYRANLKTLFADANRLLLNNTASALGIDRTSLTLPLKAGNERIIVVSNSIAPNEPVLNHKNAGYICSGNLIPVIPFISMTAPLIMKQCLRQWLRALIAKEYNLHTTSDEIIFIAMALNLQTQLVLLNDQTLMSLKVSTAYKNLIAVLLEKKRLNSTLTEMEALLNGNLFIANDGNLQNFENYLKRVRTLMGLSTDVQPLLIWYALCAAYSPELAKSQWRHCQQHLGSRLTLKDFADWPTGNISIYLIPEQLEYECYITFESTQQVGGMRFLPHDFLVKMRPDQAVVKCCPRYVLSKAGFDQCFAGKETMQCPNCYANIGKNSFEEIGPMGDISNPKLALVETNSIFKDRTVQAHAPASFSSSSSSSSSTQGISNAATPGRLIVLIGVVGCGKTTFAKAMKEIATRENRHCIVEGTDKYCMEGLSMQNAIAQVKSALINVFNLVDKDKTVILDSCNERFDVKNVFGVDFSSWRIEKVEVNLDRSMVRQYLAWSLRNVLRRKATDSYLNPPKSGSNICIKVHLRKAKGIFGQQTAPLMEENKPLDRAISELNERADEYQTMLDNNKEKFAAKF